MATKLDTLKELLAPIGLYRQSGKTDLLKMGIANYNRPFALVCLTEHYAKLMRLDNRHCMIVTPQSPSKLRGFSGPVIYDQEFINYYVKEVINEIVKFDGDRYDDLYKVLCKTKDKLCTANGDNGRLKSKLDDLTKKYDELAYESEEFVDAYHEIDNIVDVSFSVGAEQCVIRSKTFPNIDLFEMARKFSLDEGRDVSVRSNEYGTILKFYNTKKRHG